MKVVCISGKAQHGKDTTAGMMKTVLESMGHTVLIAHYGDLVKYVCRTFFGWNGEKDAYGRSLLQKVGTDIVRSARISGLILSKICSQCSQTNGILFLFLTADFQMRSTV